MRNCSASVPCRRARPGAFGHDDEQDRRRGEAEAGQPEEQALPAHDRQRPFDGQGRRHRAEAARHHVEARDQAPALGRIPQRDRLDGGHQAAGEAEANQHARHDQLAEREAEAKQRRAGRRHRQQHDLHAARPVAVEHDAQHRLAAGEEQEEGRGEQPEIARGDADVALEIGEDHGVHAAEDVGEEIGERERQEDPQEQRGEGRGACGHCQSIQEMRND